ncbi:hypothetical protein MMC06_001406 [Schaereria dolodes]|nr:hypothetical protein [Schaereria dolodes]
MRLPSIDMLTTIAPTSTLQNPSSSYSSSDFDSLQKAVQIIYQSSRLTIQQMEDLPDHLHTIRLLHLSTGSRVILKISPPAATPLLKHERLDLETEALTLRLLAKSGLPVPSVVKHERSGKILGSPFLLTSHLSGTSYRQALPFLSRAERVSIERQISILTSTIAQNISSEFGPVALVASGQGFMSWREAYKSMLESVLRDAEDFLVNLPYAQIREQVRRAEHALDEVQEARLVVLGLADAANVLIDLRTKEVTGVTDFKRVIWGDAEMLKAGGPMSMRRMLYFLQPPTLKVHSADHTQIRVL